MSSSLEKAVAQKKEAIEAAMEMFKGGAEVLASAVGELFPLCEAASPVLKLALDNVHSKEVLYVKEQFLAVRDKLDVLSGQLEDIDSEIKKGRLDAQYFPAEENIRNQFRKYVDILEAKQQFREVKTRLFLEHFAATGGEKNLYVLYDALMGTSSFGEPVLEVVERSEDILEAKQQFREVKTRLFLEHFAATGGEKNLYVLYDALMGTSSFGEPVLEVVERYVGRSRRLLEDFCARMKELLCLGLIALLGHCALTLQSPDEERDKIQEWSAKIEEVESKMKAAVASCVAAFPEQAKLDAGRLLKDKKMDGGLQETAQQLLDFLVKKYDWVCWSVRLVDHSGSTYRNWRAGERFHQVSGQSWFEVAQGDAVSLVASHSARPQPVPRALIQEAMEAQGRRRGNAPAAVEQLEQRLSGFVVHAVSRHKQSAAAWSFPDDCHYWERHKNVAVCVHSE